MWTEALFHDSILCMFSFCEVKGSENIVRFIPHRIQKGLTCTMLLFLKVRRQSWISQSAIAIWASLQVGWRWLNLVGSRSSAWGYNSSWWFGHLMYTWSQSEVSVHYYAPLLRVSASAGLKVLLRHRCHHVHVVWSDLCAPVGSRQICIHPQFSSCP